MSINEIIKFHAMSCPCSLIHRIKGELPPEDAARECEREIGDVFGSADVLALAIAHLGIGSDGHTASLFPSSESLQEKKRLAVPVYVEKLSSWRATLPLPVLNNARHIVFLVSGKGEGEAFSRIHTSGERGPHLPASLVTPVNGSLTWLVDRDAASLMSNLTSQ